MPVFHHEVLKEWEAVVTRYAQGSSSRVSLLLTVIKGPARGGRYIISFDEDTSAPCDLEWLEFLPMHLIPSVAARQRIRGWNDFEGEIISIHLEDHYVSSCDE